MADDMRQAVADAIREIEAAGGNVSVRAVRDQIGRGSFSTISPILSELRKADAPQTLPVVRKAPPPPREFGEMWEQIWAMADEAFAHERAHHVTALQSERNVTADLRDYCEGIDAANADLQSTVARLERSLEAARKKNAEMRGEIKGLNAALASRTAPSAPAEPAD